VSGTVKGYTFYTASIFDSAIDIVLNILIFLVLRQRINYGDFVCTVLAFSVAVQGTLYNYYYVIFRNNFRRMLQVEF